MEGRVRVRQYMEVRSGRIGGSASPGLAEARLDMVVRLSGTGKVLLLAHYSAFGREEKSSPGVLAFYFAERYLYSSCSTTYSTCTYTTCTSLTCTHLSTAIHTLL